MAPLVASCPALLCTKILVLVTFCWLAGGMHAVTLEGIAELIPGPIWNVTELLLPNKGLVGSIPSELGSLTNLTVIALGDNALSGPIPLGLGNLTQLTTLSLFKNKLSGRIPIELGHLTLLDTLELGNNTLSGPIPLQLGNMASLRYLYLYANNLSGHVPSTLGNLKDLYTIGLDRNSLSGPIPSEFGNLKSLGELYLQDNNLSGSIPLEIDNLTRLIDLDVRNNNLTGFVATTLVTKFGAAYFDGNPGLCFNGSDPTCIAPQPTTFSPSPPSPPSPIAPPPSSSPPSIPHTLSPPAKFPSGAPPPNLEPPASMPAPSPSSSSIGPIAGGVAAGAAFIAVAVFVGWYYLFRRRRHMSNSAADLDSVMCPGKEGTQQPAPKQSVPMYPAPKPQQELFTLKQLQRATRNFDEANIIGRGSFGQVYKGTLANGMVVAVKRLESRRGRKHNEERAWRAEVDALGKVRHKNLVPLVGVCVEREERLLVFEYFVRGSLDKRLHHRGEGEAVLSWPDRTSIARSICCGLAYLHNGIRPPMVHRDIKAANVLLFNDDDLDACIADFGLAHLVQDEGGKTSTMVKGTVPYMAPEYLHGGTQFLSPKCDVYSFGVLLLELISGRRVVRQLESGVVERLSEVAVDLYKEGRVLELVDSKLAGNYDAEEARNFVLVALACLKRNPVGRPTMESVASRLALAPVEDMAFDEVDIERGSEGSGELFPVQTSSSSSACSMQQSTVLVASRFVTPR